LLLCRHAEPDRMTGLSFEHLYVDRLVLAVRPGHPLARFDAVKVEDLTAYTAILPIKGSLHRHTVDTFLQTEGIEPPEDFIESLSVSFGHAYTVQSDAIWFASWSAIKQGVKTGLLTTLPLQTKDDDEPGGAMARSICLMTRTN